MERICTLILLCFCSSIFAQATNVKSKTTNYSLVSEENNKYEIVVTIPPYYDDSKNYKTLYYLDGWWLEDVVKGDYIILNRAGDVEDIILVGISVNGSYEEFTRQRTRDYTPTPYDMNLPFFLTVESGSFMIDSTNSGEADAFKLFLSDKVFPFVSTKYAVDKEDRGFIGHSFGGLFGIYDAMDKAPLFSKYIIISPALWWNKSLILYEKIESKLKNNNTKANMFICYGKSESISIVMTTNRLFEYFKKHKLDEVYKLKVYEDENHTSILPKSIYDGIEYFYKK